MTPACKSVALSINPDIHYSLLARGKRYVSSISVFYFFDYFRRLPSIVSWLLEGCVGVAPRPIKRRILWSYIVKFKLKNFIETGTYFGDTLAYIANARSVFCTSIEVEPRLFETARKRFQGYSNVNLLHGDSAILLSDAVVASSGATLYWLDGHYSGGITGRGEQDTPILKELSVIFAQAKGDYIILIDDARCFDGTNGYPTLDHLLALIREKGEFAVQISADIIRVVPQKLV